MLLPRGELVEGTVTAGAKAGVVTAAVASGLAVLAEEPADVVGNGTEVPAKDA